MYRTQGVLALLALYLGLAHCFSWDIVVPGDKQLQFYDSNGTRTHTETIPLDYTITSLAYDPVHNCVLFADEGWKNYSISSFNIATRKIIILVSVAGDTYVRIAYDPITSLLFWIERSGGRYSIYSKGYSIAGDKNLLIKLDGDEYIGCITVDICGEYIYWSTISKIERARLDGSEREVVIDKKVDFRGGIAIDHHTQKMYWLDNMYYADAYQITIESADLNGENRRTLYNEQNTYYGGALVVSKDFIYWRTDMKFSQLTRNPPHDKEVKAKQFLLARSLDIMAMASNYKIEDQTQGIQNCESQKRLLPIKSETNECASLNVSTDVSLLCVHGTKVSGESRCECTLGYIGESCEVSVCHNYCLQGDCSVSAEGLPKCRCNASYSGERCEVSLCQNYCFQGDCSASAEGQLMCRCITGYSGERCEVNACHEYCSNNGVCVLNDESEPFCQCSGDYEGERCNVSVCQNYCFQGDCSVSAKGQPKCRCNAGYSGDRCEVNANNTLKGWRIDHALVNFTDDIKDTLRGLREEIGMSKLNDSINCTLSDTKQEMNTLRSELDKLKDSVRTVAHDVSELKSSAQFQAAEQNELKGLVDTSTRHSSDQSQILVNTQVQVKFTSSQKGAVKT